MCVIAYMIAVSNNFTRILYTILQDDQNVGIALLSTVQS